jgi:hypothetical protein
MIAFDRTSRLGRRGGLVLAKEAALLTSSRARRSSQPAASASAASQPTDTPIGGVIIATDAAPAATMAFAAASANASPAVSASGQITTRRPPNGDQSALAALFAPFGLVTATRPGRSRSAASQAFSPSVTSTGAEGFSESPVSP